MSPSVGWLPFTNDRKVPSVRMRSLRPVRYLRGSGLDARVVSAPVPDSVDVLVLQKAYQQEHRTLATRHRARGGSVVLDLCDNHFYNPDDDPVLAQRAEQLRRTLEVVDAVSVCTPELAEIVQHPTVLTVNDALDPQPRLPAARWLSKRSRRLPRVLWFGTAGAHGLPFGMCDLARILPELGAAAREESFELVVSSNSRTAFDALVPEPGLRMRYFPWRRATFPLLAATADVTVLPVEVNPVTRGKTSNRVATAIRLGLAVVTDPLPSYLAYAGAVAFGDFRPSVLAYLRDPGLRRADVSRGVEITESLYAPEVVTSQWRRVVETAAARRAEAG